MACVKLFADDAKPFGRVNSIMQSANIQINLNNAACHFKNADIYKLHGTHDVKFEYTMETESGRVKVEMVKAEIESRRVKVVKVTAETEVII